MLSRKLLKINARNFHQRKALGKKRILHVFLKAMHSEFTKRLDASEEEQLEFFDPIKKAPWQGFKKIDKKVSVSAKGKTRDLAVQRDILGLLMAESYKEKASIDIDKAIFYSLAPVPLAIATSDGIRRKTAKSKV